MRRPRSYAICGGAYGDEGKGRIVDEFVHTLAKKGKVIVYRDNGGANAGHTVTLPSGVRIALHQLPSGIFSPQATVILGKGMVVHPGDLVTELTQAQAVGVPLGTMIIDEMVVVSLDTHRAFEAVLKMWQTGSKGSTGRGIAPAYADVLLRHPLRMRNLIGTEKTQKEYLTEHYTLYAALTQGLGGDLASTQVPQLGGKDHPVGSLRQFINRTQSQLNVLRSYSKDVSVLIATAWANPKIGFVFEKAQAIGLDARWGVYPDITASNTAPDGITASTEGSVLYQDIEQRIAVIKATYMSSVGSRVLPGMMKKSLAEKIREDAHEYGATTGRPRDIAYLDIPALRFYARVGGITHHVLTHMDIAYPKIPIKVCVGYTKSGKPAEYRPDQQYLNSVKPVYKTFESWDGAALQSTRRANDLPKAAKTFIAYLEKSLNTKVIMITTGPQRHQGLKLPAR